MAQTKFTTDLKRLGLKDKEAAVYLACLELGPSPVQQISRKAKVVRATTYVVLESLAKQGLVTQFKEGKKTLFAAEPPRQLLRLLEKQEETIKERKHELDHLLPELQVFMKASDSSPTVRYFDGIEGLRAIRSEMLMYSRPKDLWLNFTPIDYLTGIFTNETENSIYRQRISKKIQAKTIFVTTSPKSLMETFAEYRDNLTERRFLATEDLLGASGLTIYRDRIAIGVFTGKVGGVVIESEAMVQTFRNLFNLAWTSAKDLDTLAN